MDWVADVIQHKERPHPHSYLGKGKLEELTAAVKETGATVAVCEDDLSPGQVAAVLDAVDVDVLDRTELILTVFSKHAHSLEGTMQVHLAQLEYELTRMRGKGHILSRLGAGVNMRGPGETKLEVDRRVVRQRIQTLRRRIDHMAKTRRTQRARRAARRRPAHRPGRLHQRRQVHAAQRPHRRHRAGARPALRDARPDVAVVPLPRPRLRAHRHRRLHPQAAAPAGRRVRQHPRGDHARRRRPRGRRRAPRGVRGRRAPARRWQRCSTSSAPRRRGSSSSTRSTWPTRASWRACGPSTRRPSSSPPPAVEGLDRLQERLARSSTAPCGPCACCSRTPRRGDAPPARRRQRRARGAHARGRGLHGPPARGRGGPLRRYASIAAHRRRPRTASPTRAERSVSRRVRRTAP